MAENREVKSDVFSMLMENKRYALEVYNGVNGSSYDDPEMVEVTTLKKGISLSIRNDASIIVDMNLNLYEHQSTYSPNMPLRSLIYLVDIIKPYVKDKDIFGRRLVKIPTPKFIVFYNGREQRPATEVLKLSDSFEKMTNEPQLELTCTVYNINPGYNDDLLEKCKILNEYTLFIERIRYNESNNDDAPIENAISWCIEHNILKDFLLVRRQEVLKAMTIDMTFERREELIRRDERAEGFADGISQGISQGISKGMTMLLIAQVKDNEITIESAAKRLGITEEEFEKLLSEK